MKTYTRRDVMRLTGATNSHLTYWTKLGVVRSTGDEAPGTGNHRQHGFADLVDAQLAVYLTRVGIPIKDILYALNVLRLAITGDRGPVFAHLDARRRAARGTLRRQYDEDHEAYEASLRPYAESWREFLDPSTRSNIIQIGFIYVPHDVPAAPPQDYQSGSWRPLLERAGVPVDLSGIDVVHVVVNVGLLVSQMESATGDSYDLAGTVSDVRTRSKG